MAILLGVSVLFAAIAFLVRRAWTVALPFVAWLGVAGLAAAGVLAGETTVGSSLLAGIVGSMFAFGGLILGERAARQRPRG